MTFDPGSAEQQIEQRFAMLIREADELAMIAANRETVDLIPRQGAYNLLRGALLITNLLEAQQPPKFKPFSVQAAE